MFEPRSTRLFYAAARPAVLRLVAPHVAAFGTRPLPAAERGLGWGKKSAVLTADPPLFSPLAHASNHSLVGVILSLGHDFGTENPALWTLFSAPKEPCHRLFTFFLLAISTTYVR